MVIRKGQACEKLKRYKEAAEAYQTSIDKDPDSKASKSTAKKVKEMTEAAENAPVEEEKAKVEEKKPPPPVMSKPTGNKPKPKPTAKGAEKLRGYKVREDGTKTTFFNNDLTEEEKALIGDIAPKKVENVDAVNKAGVGSAWSNGTTYEERDVTKWAKGRVKELIAEAEFAIPADEVAAVSGDGGADGDGKLMVAKVTKMEGDASIPIIRGEWARASMWRACRALTYAPCPFLLPVPQASHDTSSI